MERLIAYICTIKCRHNELSVNCNLQINGSSLQKYCLYDMVEIGWIHSNSKLFHNDPEQELPKYVYIPFTTNLKLVSGKIKNVW